MRDIGIILKKRREFKNIKTNLNIFGSGYMTRESGTTLNCNEKPNKCQFKCHELFPLIICCILTTYTYKFSSMTSIFHVL